MCGVRQIRRHWLVVFLLVALVGVPRFGEERVATAAAAPATSAAASPSPTTVTTALRGMAVTFVENVGTFPGSRPNADGSPLTVTSTATPRTTMPSATATITLTPSLTRTITPTTIPSATRTATATPTVTRTPNPNARVTNVRISDIGSSAAVISWETTDTAGGAIIYAVSGTLALTPLSVLPSRGAREGPGARDATPLSRAASAAMEVRAAHDVRGADYAGDTHYVVLGGLTPSTTYQFVVDADGLIADDGGVPYVVQTGPELFPPDPQIAITGRLHTATGAFADGCLLSIRVSDGDGVGSPGNSVWLTDLVYEFGEWVITLRPRTADALDYFDYRIGDDELLLEVRCGARGSLRRAYRTSVLDERAGLGDLGDLQLESTVMLPTAPLTLVHGWNLVALPIQPVGQLDADSLGYILASQGITVTQVAQWDGWWHAHLVGRLTNNFRLEPGRGYFVSVRGAGGTANLAGLPIERAVRVSGLTVGWNLIAVPHPATFRAADLGRALSASGITTPQVVRWDEASGQWSPHLVGRVSNNFTIERGRGYFVLITRLAGPDEFTP